MTTQFASKSRPYGPQISLSVNMDDTQCYWCRGRIRWAPIAKRWWHLRDGRYFCGTFGHLAEVFAIPGGSR